MFIWNPSSVTSCFFAYLQESHPKTLLSHLGRIAAWTRMTKRDGRCEWGGVVCVGRRKWKTRKKGEWWQYLLHQFECLSSQVTHRSMWSANRRENIHFGEERKEEEWEWVREDGARVYLCCVSCHLCVRAHHTNCEACAHTSSITLLSAGHQHSHIDRVSEKNAFSQTRTPSLSIHDVYEHKWTYCMQFSLLRIPLGGRIRLPRTTNLSVFDWVSLWRSGTEVYSLPRPVLRLHCICTGITSHSLTPSVFGHVSWK